MKKSLHRIFAFITFSLIGISYAQETSLNYEPYMKTLIVHAKKHNPAFPFAAMIIDSNTGKELCRGINHSTDNPTYHGEIDAINQCIKQYGNSLDWPTLMPYVPRGYYLG